jgi:RNA polymerase sigma-70 factor (ECF subfamily)
MHAVDELPAGEVSWSLIARAAAGDGRARSTFSGTYLPVVRSFLAARWRETRLAGELDDAVQEVFLECLRENGVLSRADPRRGDLRGLLFGVTRKVAARFEERAGRQVPDPRTVSALEVIEDREPSLSMLFDREWARTLMRLAGERMRARAEHAGAGARLRVELLRLRFTEDLPIREIAAQWDVEPDPGHRAYARARAEFRECLTRVVAEHTVRSEVDLEDEVARAFRLLD